MQWWLNGPITVKQLMHIYVEQGLTMRWVGEGSEGGGGVFLMAILGITAQVT